MTAGTVAGGPGRWSRAVSREGPAAREAIGAVMRAAALLVAETRGLIRAPLIAPLLAAGRRGPAGDRWHRVADACDDADRRTASTLFSIRDAPLDGVDHEAAMRLLDDAAAIITPGFEPEELGLLHEIALLAARRAQGSYYTPRNVARYILARACAVLDADATPRMNAGYRHAGTLRVIDPCCGAGLFLSTALDEFMRAAPGGETPEARGERLAHLAAHQLHGVDVDRDAAHVAAMVLSLKAREIAGTDDEALPWRWRITAGDGLDPSLRRAPGFDLVLGNPPYLSHRAIGPGERERLRAGDGPTGTFDLAMLFTEAGLRMLAPGGALGFLVSNKFMASDYGERLRHLLLEEFQLREITDASSLRLFRGAAAYAVVLIASRPADRGERGEAKPVFLRTMREDGCAVASGEADPAVFRALPGAILTPRLTAGSGVLLRKLLAAGEPLRAATIRCGIARSGFARALISDESLARLPAAERAAWVPFLGTGDIGRLELSTGRARYIQRSWLGAHHARTLQHEKILIPGMARALSAAIDPGGHALGRVYYVAAPESPEPVAYLAGLMNSRVLTWCYELLFWSVHLAGDYLRVNGSYLARLPIPRSAAMNGARRDAAARIAVIARGTRTGPAAGVEPSRDDELDALVFDLFQLDPAERGLIASDLARWRAATRNATGPVPASRV